MGVSDGVWHIIIVDRELSFLRRDFLCVCMWQTQLLRLYRKAHATKTHSHPHNPIRIKQIYHYNVHNLGIKRYTYTNIVISMRYTYMYVWIRRCECVYVWVLLSFAWFFITFTFDSISHAITIMFYMPPSLPLYLFACSTSIWMNGVCVWAN